MQNFNLQSNKLSQSKIQGAMAVSEDEISIILPQQSEEEIPDTLIAQKIHKWFQIQN